MKRNITVNIFGSLYPIDEDAYAMLNAYLTNMRDYFSRQPDGKEIADDIESRVAELMTELRQDGVEAISIEHVDEIIGRIGNPEDLDPENENKGEEKQEIDETDNNKRKLFRDPENKVLGGVCSGLGCYFGLNTLLIRILALILIIPTCGVIVAIYIILWLCIPLAITPAERLRMKGKKINMSSLCEEFLSSTRSLIEKNGEFSIDERFSRGIISTFKWCMYALCIMVMILCVIAGFGIIISIICALVAPWGEMHEILGSDFPLLAVFDNNPSWLIITCCASLIVLIVLTLYLLIHFTMHIMKKVEAMSSQLRTLCVILWCVALLVFCASSSNIVSRTTIKQRTEYRSQKVKREKQRKEKREERERSYLEQGGWTLVKGENVNNYTNKGEHFSNNRGVRYLDASNKNGSMEMAYEVVRNLKVSPGTYSLKAAARANGEGAEIFALNGNGQRLSTPIPVCSNVKGSIWANAKEVLFADTALVRADRGYLLEIVDANDGKGYGWSEVVINNIIVGNDSILTYGVSNISPTRTWEGSWLSATAFEISKLDEIKK
ncbi:MAG: PspC domain-containing protein [Muribaculaceae bacterium]|nr:PspC domain-containing protein [Muribaculaceae bacterium]